jgi:ABC-type dipeptide/oligopeptide/nickel transport system permease component
VDSLLTGNWAVLWSSLTHLALPAITLGLIVAAPIARLSRAIMIDVLNSDYIRAARAYGEPPFIVTWKLGMRNALAPILNMVGVVLGYLFGGTVLIETVFSRPGLGRYAVDAIQAGDFAAVQAFVLVMTVAYVLINLVVDILVALADPRIVHG